MIRSRLQLREKRLQRTCAFNLGAAYVQAGEPQKGLDVLSRTQPGERGERIADLQYNLATAHEGLEDRTQAVRHYLQAAQLYRSQGDAAAEGDTCVRLAHCHLLGKVCYDCYVLCHMDPNWIQCNLPSQNKNSKPLA